MKSSTVSPHNNPFLSKDTGGRDRMSVWDSWPQLPPWTRDLCPGLLIQLAHVSAWGAVFQKSLLNALGLTGPQLKFWHSFALRLFPEWQLGTRHGAKFCGHSCEHTDKTLPRGGKYVCAEDKNTVKEMNGGWDGTTGRPCCGRWGKAFLMTWRLRWDLKGSQDKGKQEVPITRERCVCLRSWREASASRAEDCGRCPAWLGRPRAVCCSWAGLWCGHL